MAMTKKDFEVVAAAFARVEDRIVNGDLGVMLSPQGVLAAAMQEVTEALKDSYPRFDTGRFEKAAMPIRSEKMKQAILAKLNR